MKTGRHVEKRVIGKYAVAARRLGDALRFFVAVSMVCPSFHTLAHAAAPMTRGDPQGQPAIDWARQVFVSRALGPPDFAALNAAQARLGAEKAATAMARKEMLKILRSAPMRGGALPFGSWVQKHGDKNADVTLSQAAKVSAKRFFSDRGVEVEAEIPFYQLNSHLRSEAPPVPVDAGVAAAADAGVAPNQHSGLVVVIGSPTFQSLNPLVADSAGHVLYSVDSLSLAALKTAAVALFVQGLGSAQKRAEVGATPLVCKASVGRDGVFTLSKEDSAKVRLLEPRILLEGRVVFAVEAGKK